MKPVPDSVHTAVTLIWASVALSVLSSVVTVSMLDDLVQRVVNDTADISESAARTSVVGGVAVGIVLGVAIAVLFIHLLKRGANWARIVYTVLTGLGIAVGLFGSVDNQPVVLVALGAVSLVINAATLYFLFRPDANAFFAAPAN